MNAVNERNGDQERNGCLGSEKGGSGTQKLIERNEQPDERDDPESWW